MKSQQSLAGFIREHLATIEARLDVGIRQEVIVQELAEKGYTTTLPSFRNLIYRARKKAATTPQKNISERIQNNAKIEDKIQHKKPAENPLESKIKKPTGFQYGGTKILDENDLI
jgi:hypothetical protein